MGRRWLGLLLVGGAAAWSLDALRQRYLRCWAEPLTGRLDLFTSFRSVRGGDGTNRLFARDFSNAWLAYWPLDLGRLVIFSEPDLRTRSTVDGLAGCLARACAAAKVAVESYDVSASVGAARKVGAEGAAINANFTLTDDLQMQGWKFVLDELSAADLVGVLDDDACLLDHVLPRGDLQACDGRIVVRGVRFERRPDLPTKHERSNAFLGVDSDVLGPRGLLVFFSRAPSRPRGTARRSTSWSTSPSRVPPEP